MTLPRTMTFGESQSDISHLVGTWNACGVNPQFTLLYYTPGGHFGPHRDGCQIVSEHCRSLLTVAIYLSARPPASGGGTQFLQNDMDLQGPNATTGRIEAPESAIQATVDGDTVGKAVVFWHDVMHQGQPLAADCQEPKWLLITQVLFRRDPSSAPQWTADQRLAREFLKQAEAAEMQGHIQEAIRCYNKAYKLDPSLEC